MGHRAGGGFGNHSGEAGGAALGNDDAVGPGGVGGADHRTQVVGVGDLVAHHQQGGLALVPGGLKDALHTDVLPDRCQGDDALVGMGAAHGVQLPPVRLHHHHARRPGFGGNMSQGLVRLSLLEVNFVNRLPCPQGLNDGVAPLDDAVGLGSQVLLSPFFHNFSLNLSIFAFKR